MAPLKFDDLPKTANDVLNEDYQISGFQLKAKQKTSWDGAVSTTTVDLWGGKDVQTPAKLSWKFPKPFGLNGVAVDKFEMDKAGKFKIEISADKGIHKVADLKVETKSDLVDPSKATAGLIYTGIKDTQIKVETFPMNPQDFTLEVTRAINNFTLGAKGGLKNWQTPDLGVRFEHGKFVASLLVKEKLSKTLVNCVCSPNKDMKFALFANVVSTSKPPAMGFGLFYNVVKGTSIKAKVEQTQDVSATVKHDLAAGFTLLAGGKYNISTGSLTYGVNLSIE